MSDPRWELQLWHATSVSQRTGTEQSDVYTWAYKHEITHKEILDWVSSFGWADLGERIKLDLPLRSLADMGDALNHSIHQHAETVRRSVHPLDIKK